MEQLIDHNFAAHAQKVPSLTPGMRVFETDHLSYTDSGLSCDTFNIIHIHDGSNLDKTELETAVTYFRSRNREFCLWVHNQNLSPETGRNLSKLQLVRQNSEIGMSLDLNTYAPIHSDKHEQVKSVSDIHQLEEYSQVIAANWQPPDTNVVDYYRLTSDHYLNHKLGISLFIFFEKSLPLATVEMFPSDSETIGIYGLATLEDARGKGIGSALMTYALNTAKSRNYKQVVLQASEAGVGIYRKLGFEEFTTYYEFA